MKPAIFFVAFLLLGLAGIDNAVADHRHHGYRTSVGVVIGPYWGPWYYPPPGFYYPPVVIERAPPPVYIEQAPVAAPISETRYWYYCRKSNAYYPYVKECPAGWQRVPPQPPNTP